jgi:hypothetical protein
MLYTRQIIFSLLCVSNVTLPTSLTNKICDKYIRSIPNLSKEECKNIKKTFEKLELMIQSNNQATHFALNPLYTSDMPAAPSLSTDPEEQAFIAKLGIDVIRVAERCLITREDYIAEYSDRQSAKTLQEYRKKCILLQQKGDLNILFNEISRLHPRVMKNGKNNNMIDYISLAIAEKLYSNPVATILHTIRYAPLEKACLELENLKIQIINQSREKNVLLMAKTKELLIEQYEFDVLNAARDCYLSRNDHIDITKYQSILSNDLKNSLSIIENKNLPVAYAELIHLKKQIMEYLEPLNIEDPVAQKKIIIQNFGCDIIDLANNIYRGRLDHKKLIVYFSSIDVQDTTIAMLNNQEYDYESLSHELRKIAGHVFHNAKLCNLEVAPEVESHIYKIIDVIKAPCNDIEFILNATTINRILHDIQSKVYGIIESKPTVLERPINPFMRAVEGFIARLRPTTQTMDI